MCVCVSLSLSLFSVCLSVCLSVSAAKFFFQVQGLWQAAATWHGFHWFATVHGLWILANGSSLFLSFSLSLSLSLFEMRCESGQVGASKGPMQFCELAKIQFRVGLGSVQTSVVCESAMATWYSHWVFLGPQIWPT